VITINSGIQNC